MKTSTQAVRVLFLFSQELTTIAEQIVRIARMKGKK